LEPKVSFPNEKKCVGQWLGIAEVSINFMSSYVLTKTGTVIVLHKSIWALSSDERQTDEVKQATKELNEKILLKIDYSLTATAKETDVLNHSLHHHQKTCGMTSMMPKMLRILFDSD
jgi:uncharacterized membrane protein